MEDCDDGSDEQDCGILIVKPGYKKSLTPVPQDGKRLLVNVSLNIIDILEINELTQTFKVKLSITREWFDRRLTYRQLREDSNMNALLTQERESIWFPRLIFSNIKTSTSYEPTDVEFTLNVISKNGFSYEVRDNTHFFSGSENVLISTREFSVEWICHYRLHWYPFDTQTCHMVMPSGRKLTEQKPVRLDYSRDISLDRYTLSKIQMCQSAVDVTTVKVTLGRPIISNILTVFIPTTTLLAISFVSRFFVKNYFDLTIMVNLTILLVLATL